MTDAKSIYQDWLDRIAEAVWVRDWATIGAAMHYPHKMRTVDSAVDFDSPEKLIDAAQDFRDYLASIGAQAYLRLCDSAQFSDDHKAIEGQHTTFILRGGTHIVRPFSNTMTLLLADGAWLGAGSAAACSNHHCTILSPAQLRQDRLAQTQRMQVKDRTA